MGTGSAIAIQRWTDRCFVSSGYDRQDLREQWTLRLWKASSGQLLSSTSRFDFVPVMATDASFELLYLGGSDFSIYAVSLPSWDVKLVLRAHSANVHALQVFKGGGYVLSGGADNVLTLWQCRELT